LPFEPDVSSGLGEVFNLRELGKGVVDIFEETFLELFVLFFEGNVSHLKLGVFLLVALDFLSELFFLSLLVSNSSSFFSDLLLGLGEVGLEHLDDFLVFVFFAQEFVDISFEACDFGVALLDFSLECLFGEGELSQVGGLVFVLKL
jgi:hypothetical protein